MTTPSQPPSHVRAIEYVDAAESHTHSVLLPPVLAFLRRGGPLGTLLDVGCGNGSLSRHYLNVAQRVYGVDASESGVSLAASKLGVERVRQASAYDDLAALFPEASPFDAVVSTEVIEHLYDPRLFMQRIRAALKPGGRVVLSTPYHGYLKNLALAVTGAMDRHFTSLWDGGHIKFWSRKTLTTLLHESGFRDVEFTGAGRLRYLWMSMIMSARAA